MKTYSERHNRFVEKIMGVAAKMPNYQWILNNIIFEEEGKAYLKAETPESKYAGMALLLLEDGTYEVHEYMAGPNQDELHIFTETNNARVALLSLLKGNKGRKIVKKY